MNKLFTRYSEPNTRYLHLEAPRGPEQAQTAAPVAIESPEAFVARQNQETTRRIESIPVDPRVKDLCHDRIGDLITEASNTDFNATQAQLETSISEALNNGEGEQLATANNTPEVRQTQEEVEAERKTTEAALVTYLAQVSNALHEQAQAAQVEAQESGDEAKIAAAEEIENRGNLIGTLQETISENGIDWTNEVPFGGGSDALVSQAESTIGTQEGSEADALVGVDTASIPWCGAFVKAMCEKSGQPLPENANWNVAETYVSPEGSTGEHVAIYAGNGEMVGGNQSNAVTRTSLPGNFRFNTVENLIAGRQVDLSGQQEPQPGDIIVTSRGDGNSDSTDTAATTSTV